MVVVSLTDVRDDGDTRGGERQVKVVVTTGGAGAWRNRFCRNAVKRNGEKIGVAARP